MFPEIIRSSAEQRRINPTTSTRYLITLSREDAIPLPFTPLFLLWGWKRDVSRPHLVWTGEVSPPMVPLLGDLHPPSGGSIRPIIMRMKSCYVHDCICFTNSIVRWTSPSFGFKFFRVFRWFNQAVSHTPLPYETHLSSGDDHTPLPIWLRTPPTLPGKKPQPSCYYLLITCTCRNS